MLALMAWADPQRAVTVAPFAMLFYAWLRWSNRRDVRSNVFGLAASRSSGKEVESAAAVKTVSFKNSLRLRG